MVQESGIQKNGPPWKTPKYQHPPLPLQRDNLRQRGVYFCRKHVFFKGPIDVTLQKMVIAHLVWAALIRGSQRHFTHLCIGCNRACLKMHLETLKCVFETCISEFYSVIYKVFSTGAWAGPWTGPLQKPSAGTNKNCWKSLVDVDFNAMFMFISLYKKVNTDKHLQSRE